MEKSNSHAFLSSLIESPSDIIIVSVDRDFNYTFFNSAHKKEMKKVWGVDIKRGSNLLDYIPSDEERAKLRNNLRRVLNGRHFTKVESYGKPGNRFWYELAYNPIFDKKKNVTGVTVFITDITKRKQAEDSLRESITERIKTERNLRESEVKFKSIFNSSNDGILIVDSDSKKVFMSNPKICDMLGYTEEEFKNLGVMDIHRKKDLPKIIMKFNKMAKVEKGLAENIPVKRKNGSIFYADISSSSVKLAEKKYLVGIFRDITDRKETENELLKHHEHLGAIVKERTRELLEANKNLKIEVKVRKMAEKKLIDYQKKLQSLTSRISLIEENEKRRIAADLHDCIGQPLALSKIKLGLLNKFSQSPDQINIIKEILQLIEQTIKETRTLTFELSPPILYELGLSQAIKWLIDEFREKYNLEISLKDYGCDKPFNNNIRFFIFQAVRELLVNIVKHSQAKKASIIMLRADDELRITVEDNGTGYAGASVKNAGYGLFNIREQMNHINGHMKIRSLPGHGTRVTLVAPFNPDKKTPAGSSHES
jgi:PAS domain S-box-containing protein